MAAGHRPAESMRVLVTGATGFVGSHTVAALVERGHDVRLFVRAPERVPIALEPLGVSGRPYTVGDVTDPATVEAAMAGCDAVVHCGSAFSLNIRDGDTVRRTNVVGTEIVIDAAHRLGLDPIVHVSSFSALLPPNGRVLTAQSPVGNPRGAYFRSKADSDRIARRYQEAGAPVVITYPGTVVGPNDPHLGEVPSSLVDILKGRAPVIPTGGFPIVDVGSVARVHAAVMRPDLGARRYMVTGRYTTAAELIQMLGEVTGRRIRFVTAPARSVGARHAAGGPAAARRPAAAADKRAGVRRHGVGRALRRLGDDEGARHRLSRRPRGAGRDGALAGPHRTTVRKRSRAPGGVEARPARKGSGGFSRS